MSNKTPTQYIAVRFPPSPTGELHIGNIRTMLFNYLFAKHNELTGGESDIYMRFEDTDKERSKKEFETVALEALEALGITFNHGPYRQSERGELYTKAIKTLIDTGHAYEAESSKDDPDSKVIRFKNPNKAVTFTDAIRGEISIDTTDFGDFVIARSLNNPLYHLTVVVDDIDMGITDIIRGEDHITSTPRQILLIEALGGKVPRYAHLPMIIGEDKKKLSKRHGAVTYQKFAELGYLPEAIINYLALLGWSGKDDREYYTTQELIEVFTLEGVNKSSAMFSYEKLDSINKHYINTLPKEELEAKINQYLPSRITLFVSNAPADVKDEIIHKVIKERINKWSDVQTICDTDLAWLENPMPIDKNKIVWKNSTIQDTKTHLNKIISLVEDVSVTDWQIENIKAVIWSYAEEQGKGAVLWPMRYSLTGAERSPDPFTVAYILGKDKTIERLESAKASL